MTVKADSKGRLTGARPGEKYTRSERSDGALTYYPDTPIRYAMVKDVTAEEFEEFFGVRPGVTSVREDIKIHDLAGGTGEYLPHAMTLSKFITSEEGEIILDEFNSRMTEKVLIRIKKDPS